MISYQEHNSVKPFNLDVVFYDDFHYIPHFHKDLELVFILQGEVSLTLNATTTKIKQNELALILPNQAHSYSTEKNSKAWVCVFSKDYVPYFADFISNKTTDNVFTLPKESENYLLNNLINIDPNHPTFARTEQEKILKLSSIFNLITAEFVKQKNFISKASNKTDLYRKIIEYIANNYTENISLDTLSNHLGYEKHYLSRYFNNCFNTNFNNFVNSYRTDYAKKLLAQKELTIAEISFKTGFGSVRSFNRAFLEIEKLTPTEYIKSL